MKKQTTKKTILIEAQDAVYGDRQADYGTVTENFNRIADYWNVTLKDKLIEPISADEVGLMMIGTKIARQQFRNKRDNLVDIAGYAATLEKLHNGQ